MQQEALAQVDARVGVVRGAHAAGLCLFDAGWHQGVIGLVASRIKDRVHRPVIAFAARRARLGQGIGAIGRGSPRARRARRHRDPQPGAARQVRRPRDGGGDDAARVEPRRVRARSSRRKSSAAHRRRTPSPATCTRTARCLPANSTPTTAEALSEGGPWGSGFPEPAFDGVLRRGRGRASSATATSSCGSRRRRASSSTRSPSATSTTQRAPAITPQQSVAARVPHGVDEYSGARRLQLVSEWLRRRAVTPGPACQAVRAAQPGGEC